MRSSLGAACLAALLLTLGCGAEQAPETAPAPVRLKILDEEELTRALLTEDTVGAGFVAERFGWNINDTGWPGCLEPLNGITYFSAPTREVLVGIHADTDQNFPVIMSAAAAFSTEKEAADALPALRDKLADCTTIEVVENGTRFDLRVTREDERGPRAVDDQVNVLARGSMHVEGGNVPLSFGFSVARVENNVVLSGFLTARSGSVSTETAAVLDAAVARLVAVARGSSVPKGPSLGFEPFEPDFGPGTAT